MSSKFTRIIFIFVQVLALLISLKSYADGGHSGSASSAGGSLTSEQKHGTVNAGVSEGLSVREAITLSEENSWSYSASTASFRSLDQYPEDSYWSLGADLSYNLGKGQSITSSLSYFTTTDKLDSDPQRFGISDLSVSWLIPKLWKNSNGRMLSLSMTAIAPLSERSKRETLLGSLSTSLSLRQTLAGRLKFLTLSTFGVLVLNHYTYNTTDAFGTDVNSPLGLAIGASATSRLSHTLFWTNSFSLYNRMDYNSYWKHIQSVGTGLSLLLNEKFRVYGEYRWRDRVSTNDAFLDDDKSRITIGSSYFF